MVIILIAASISSFILTYIFSYIMIHLAKRYSLYDMPGGRKLHKYPVPTLGGLSFIATFYIIVVGGFIVYPDFVSQILFHNLTALVLSQLLIVGIGIYDDVRGLSPLVKFSVQIASSLILIYILDISVGILTNPFGGEISLGILSVPITILWLVGITNAINLLDGLDGLAAGVILISSLSLSLASLYQRQNGVAVLFMILVFSMLAFLKFNFYKAKIFMGNTGSLFLGFTVATLSLLISRKTTVSLALLVPIISLGIPILDTSLSFFRRVSKSQNPFIGDKLHIHHILLKSGLSHPQVVILIYLITFLLSIISLTFMVIPGRYSLLILPIVAVIIVIAVVSLRFLEGNR